MKRCSFLFYFFFVFGILYFSFLNEIFVFNTMVRVFYKSQFFSTFISNHKLLYLFDFQFSRERDIYQKKTFLTSFRNTWSSLCTFEKCLLRIRCTHTHTLMKTHKEIKTGFLSFNLKIVWHWTKILFFSLCLSHFPNGSSCAIKIH